MIARPALPLFPVLLLSTVVCFLAGGAPAAQAQDALATSRKQFMEAYASLQPGAQSPVQPGDEGIREYPLYAYLQSARIQRALAAATAPEDTADSDAAAFLEQYADAPVSAALRRSWLTSLAQRQQWTAYLARYPETLTDPAFNCQALNARIETGQTTDLKPRIIKQWLEPGQLPPACERTFTWAREQNVLDAGLIEQRVRLILAKGDARFARLIARDLPAPRAAPLLKWASLLEQPRREIDVLIATPSTPVEPEALLAGWTRLASSDLDYARERFASLVKARDLEPAAASPYALALAMRLAWNRRPEALAYFARVRAQDFDETSLEWWARASLWQSDWKTLKAAIAAMPPALSQTARWRYWAARGAAAQGEMETARSLYISLLSADNYFSAMAAARLDLGLTPNPVAVVADEPELARIAGVPAFVRAHELLLAGMRSEALAEWQFGVRTLPPAAQAQVVHLGMRWQWYDVSIATATQQRIFEDYSLLYPRPYDADVQSAVAASGLPTELVYSVMRQESLYRQDAISSAGAVGLLQLLPETARRTARRSQYPVPGPSDLLNPAINVRLGAAHLKELIEQFDGQIPVALAGYNAGPNAAQRWLPDQPIDTDIWIENIPFNETRNYVQRILWHSVVFSWLGSGQPQTTKHWLTAVSRGNANREAASGCQEGKPATISSTPLMMNCTPMQMSMKPMMRATAFMPVAPSNLSSRVAARSTM